MNDNYTELVTIRHVKGQYAPMCKSEVVKLTTHKATYPIQEFTHKKKIDSLKDFEQAIDNIIKFAALEIEPGDCLVYGTKEVRWAMLALASIPDSLCLFPYKQVPGKRVFMIMLPDSLDKKYIEECLDKL